MPATRLSDRVWARLAQAEACEPNPHYRDDLQIAKLTVLYAASGEAVLCSPQVLASYAVLGLHPEKVWPAIQARRKALGPLRIAPPKKPAQSVKLWSEKVNGARAANSRAADEMVLRGPRLLPMATASIAALYPNPSDPSSAKKRGYTYAEMLAIVEHSGAPHSIRQGTLSALKARGRWPGDDGPATGVICISLIGMMLHGVCCRSTARWRARRACALGYWRKLRDANAWSNCPKCGENRRVGTCGKCGYQGRAKNPDGSANFGEFCRPWMYEIDIEKFRSAPRPVEIRHFCARTYAEYKDAAKRGEHANVTEFPRKPAQPDKPMPPAPAAPLPVRSKPAAQYESREPLSITRDVRIAIAGCYSNARKQGKDDEAAIAEVGESLSSERYYLAPSEVRLQLKIWQSKHGSLNPPVKQERKNVRCFTCEDTREVWNKGAGPRKLPCPDCSTNSS